MLVYYLSIILIALVIAGVVLAKLHISKIVGENKGLIIFIYAIFIFGVIDMFWGLTYYDCIAELTYNPQTNQIVELNQFMHLNINIKSGSIVGMSAKGVAVLDNYMYIKDFCAE